jgi:hypothetical protein
MSTGRLSKAEWNRLRKATSAFKATLLRPSKVGDWTLTKDKRSWMHQRPKTRAAKAQAAEGDGNAD